MIKTRNGAVIGTGGPRIYRRRDLPTVTGLGLSTIYEQIAAGEFPKPFKLGKRAVGWRAEAVEAWLAERERASEAAE